MKQAVAKGATSQSAFVFIRDSSATTGVGLTGLVFNSAGLSASYVRPGAARQAITLATQTVTGSYSSGGFVEVDATNMPGVYRFDVPDAVFASGVNSAAVMLRGATNMEPCVMEFQLTSVNLQDSVRAGMTALPNVAAGASGGLPLGDANGAVKIQTVLKKNTTRSNYAFLMTDSTTHNPAAGKTVTVTRCIDNGTFAAGTLGAVTEIANGMYRIDLPAADLNGDVVTLRFTASGCDDLFVTLLLEP